MVVATRAGYQTGLFGPAGAQNHPDTGAGALQIGGAADVSLNWRWSRGRIVLARRSANQDLRRFKSIALGGALAVTSIASALTFPAPKADATPYFARQTGRSCSFCHRGVPRLNDTGLAFKNHGFRFPEGNGPPDKDHNDAPRP
jgi:hypothetical protein